MAFSDSDSASKEFGLKKKNRGNSSARLKQSKLEARRDQWLSQGSEKEKRCDGEQQPLGMQGRKARENLLEVQIGRVEENDNGSVRNDWDSVISPNSSSSALGETDSGSNFTASYTCSISCSSSDWFSGNVMEGEGERRGGDGDGDDDSCVDDWEAIADALNVDDHAKQEDDDLSNLGLPYSPTHEHIGQLDSDLSDLDLKRECLRTVSLRLASGNCRAWRMGVESQPQFRHNSVKQKSFPGAGRHYGRGSRTAPSLRGGRNTLDTVTSTVNEPSPCPICYEDMDCTDLSFFPCSCGYQLCLFCYKRILDDDRPCPNCRKPYEKVPLEAEVDISGRSLTFRLARSCRKTARS